MADWKNILDELRKEGSTHDIIRRKYLLALNKVTKRNVIAYYSGWLQKKSPELRGDLGINDSDKNGFMTAIHKLDPKNGLDLILHTPGGEVAATESIIDYLTTKFDDIRVIVPQLAMSGGTMIACAANVIVMGKQSSLGPIDPQFNGVAAHGILEEFEQAHEEIKKDNSRIAVWQPIIAKYHPTLIGECQKAVKWSKEIARNSLQSRMLKGPGMGRTVGKIIKELTSHSITLSHSRHLSAQKCIDLGLVIELLEGNQKFQDAVLSVHHAFMHTLSATPAFKIIENHMGVAYIQAMQAMIIQQT